MTTIVLLALSHIAAFVSGAFAHRWLAHKAAPVIATASSILNDATKQ